MAQFQSQESILLALRDAASESQCRDFACRCCRRIAQFITDDRAHHALQIAEDFVASRATEFELAAARVIAQEAVVDAVDTAWAAEAEANFSYTPEWCKAAAHLYAVRAVRQALSCSAKHPDDDWRLIDMRRDTSSWAAASVAHDAMANSLMQHGDKGRSEAINIAKRERERVRDAEMIEQISLLNSILNGKNDHLEQSPV